MKYVSFVTSLVLAFSFAGAADASAPVEKKFPSKYAVHQQAGPVCPHLPWLNLNKIRDMRRGPEGAIQMQDEDYTTKVHAYASFYPRIRVLDKMYNDLREANGAYSQYENQLRAEGIRENKRFDEEGRPIEKMDENPLDKARRPSYSPYNFANETRPYRLLPLLLKDGKLAFYDYTTRKATPIQKIDGWKDDNSVGLWISSGFIGNKHQWFNFEPWMFQAMGVTDWDLKLSGLTEVAGFDLGFTVKSDEKYDEYFYDVGTYQHMLFACGVKNDNTSFTAEDTSLEAAASREFREALAKNPDNPWFSINKDDLFEYQLAEIFKTNQELKLKAMASVGFYNDCWKFYQESLDLYDSADKATRVQIRNKQHLLPGEDQMLAYLFSGQLRFLWATSISVDALADVEELEDKIGEEAIQQLKQSGIQDEVIRAANAKKYTAGKETFSFLDAWTAIKGAMKAKGVKKDLVSFSSHGSVISLDDDLVKKQSHESRPTAEALGFEMWDSTYDKGIKPFYRKAGDESDLITF